MKYFLTAVAAIVIFVNTNTYGQQKYPDSKQDIERSVRNVADRIMQRSTFKIVDTKTGETSQSSKNLPDGASYKVESPYNGWGYWNGVMNIGFITMGNQLGDPQYIEYAKKNVGFVFDHDVYFKKQYDNGVRGTGMEGKFHMALLDNCGSMGAGVLAVHQIDPQKSYREYLDRAANYIMAKEKRMEDGTFCRTFPYEMTVWGDDLYMSVPFLTRMGALTGEQKYFDEAANQVLLFNKHLWNSQARIFFHCWYDDIRQNGVAHWGRCNGWILMAQVELLDKLPASHPKRDELISLLTRQIVGLCRYQDASGLWRQLIDMENTYLETSSTAIFTIPLPRQSTKGGSIPGTHT